MKKTRLDWLTDAGAVIAAAAICVLLAEAVLAIWDAVT